MSYEKNILSDEEAMIKALSNTNIHIFRYNVRERSVTLSPQMCEALGCEPYYDNMPYSCEDFFIRPADVPAFRRMYEKINKGEETASIEYLSKTDIWLRATLTVTVRSEEGEPLEAIGIVENLTTIKTCEQVYNEWLNALSEVYDIHCLIDLQDGTYRVMRDNSSLVTETVVSGNFEEAVKLNSEKYVLEEDRPEYLCKLSIDYIMFHLGRKNRSYTFEYRTLSQHGGYHWVRGTVILVGSGDGPIRNVMFTVEYIDEEKAEMALLESSLALMRDTYYRIGCIDLNRNSMRTITISESERAEVSGFREDFGRAIRDFAKSYVLAEYREKFLNIMIPERIREIFDNGADYIDITYRRLESGVPQWVRTELVPLRGYSEKNRQVMWYVKNISEEKAVEDKLTQKLLQMNTDVNLRIRTMLDGISGGFKISINDDSYTYYYVSESTAELFGYSLEEFTEVTGNSAIGNVYAPDRKKALDDIKAFREGSSSSYSLKYRVKCRDGSLKWIVDSGKRVVNEEGKVLVYSLYQDVTELEDRNNELKNALSMFDQMIRSLDCGILAYRLPGREVLALNDEAKRLFGWISGNSGTVSIGDLMSENILEEDKPKISAATKTLRKPDDHSTFEFRVRHTNGSVYRLQAVTGMLAFEDGSRYILSTVNDITEQTEVYEILREERMQFRDALTSNCEYVFSFDLTGGMVTQEFITNHGVNLIRGLGMAVPADYDAMVKKWIEQFKPKFLAEGSEKGLLREPLIEKFSNGQRTYELEYYSPVTDVYTRISILMSQSKRNGHIMAVVVGNDTTENRRKENEAKKALEDAYEAAKLANAAKSDFLSRMSHDIRTPMNAIIGMTAIAGTHLDDPDRVKDCLSKITLSSGHLLSLINEVLDMSKIESGKIDLCSEEFNLSDLIDTLLSMIRSQIKAKHLDLSVQINDIAHEKVIGDSLRIQQAFLNIMSNAVKYTPEGGSISLIISEKPNHSDLVGRYEFIFRDTGIGMEKEFIEHIFEPFARADDSRVSKTQGTGLGLAITDNLVRMMNGSIKVESELGKGTTFTVDISLKLQNEKEVSYDGLAELPVLVADDDEITCETTCHILEEMGMKGEWVLDGKSAVEKVVERHKRGKEYFAVIIDWQMPEMDGIQTAREIRRQVGNEVPIIIISAYDWSDIELEARAAGADAFIGKPLFKSRLAHIFHSMISGEAGGEGVSRADEAETLKKEDFSGTRVLMAEDNELNAEIAAELLRMMNIEVDIAENGRVAVDMFSAQPEEGWYDMVLMDIQMPIMNGNDATRAIRSLPRRDAKSVPIIAMTANAFASDVQAALSAGMNEHIAKPLDLKQFIATLRRWLPDN